MVTKRERARLLAKKKKLTKKSVVSESSALKKKKALLKEQVGLKREIKKQKKLLKEASNGTGVDKIYELVDEMGVSKETVIDAYYAYSGMSDIRQFLESIGGDYDVVVDMEDAVEILGEDTVFTELVGWMSGDEILEFLESEFDIGDDEDEYDSSVVEYEDFLERVNKAISEAKVDIGEYDTEYYEYREDYISDINDSLGYISESATIDVISDTILVSWEVGEKTIEISLNVLSDDLSNMKNYEESNILYAYDGDMNKMSVM